MAMDQDSLKILDEIREFDDIIAVEFRPDMQDVRAVCGLFAGFERTEHGAWYLILNGKATIRTIDIVSVRRRQVVQA